VVHTVRLSLAGADFDIVRETRLAWAISHGVAWPTEYLKATTHPHGGVQGASNLIVLLQTRATSQDLGEPELTDGTLHVLNLPLRRRRRLDPLCWLSANTADHVGMGEGLGGSLRGFQVERGWNWLGDARVQRRGTAGDDEGVVRLVPGHGPVPRRRTDKR
jgi:hypothetical protein